MAILFSSPGDFVSRSATFLDATSDWSTLFWFSRGTGSTPTGGAYRTYRVLGDPAYSDPYIWVGSSTDTDDVFFEAYDGTSFFDRSVSIAGSNPWHWLGASYNSTSHVISVFIDGMPLGSAISVDLSAFGAVTDDYLGNDTSGAASDIGIAYERTWQAQKTLAQFIAEAASATPVIAANLLSASPFTSNTDLVDAAGGHDWTLSGSASTTAGPSFAPSLPNGTLAFSGFGDTPMKFYSSTGVELQPPVTWPTCGSGCDGIVTLKGSGKVGVIGGNTPNFPTTGVGIFAADFLTSVEGVATGSPAQAGRSIARDDSGRFYGASGRRLFCYNADGTVAATWTTLSANWEILHVGVNGAGTIAYLGAYHQGDIGFPPATTVYAWDLVGDSSLGTFASEAGYHLNSHNAILALSNGEVLVGWSKNGAAGYVKHYSAAGATLYTYTLSGTNPASSALSYGVTDTTFWIDYYDDALSTPSSVTLAEIELVTGTVVHSWSPESGAFEFDGSFTVLIGTTTAPPAGPFLAFITDSLTNGYRDVVVGGGSLPVLGMFNGTDWIVIGK